MMWVLKRTVSMRQFFWAPKTYAKIFTILHWKFLFILTGDAVSTLVFSLGYGKCSQILNTFLVWFSNKMLIFRAGKYKLLVRIANRENPDQTASSVLLVKTF